MLRNRYRGVLSAAMMMAVAWVLAGSAFAATEKPSITSFTPTSGKTGATVTITGKDLIGTTAIEIGGVTATFKIGSTTRITAIVPKDGKTGKIHVTTTPPPGVTANTATSAKSFTVT